MPEVLLDAAGRPRSPATLPGFHAGRPPRNKGQRYPADPPTVTEIVAVMRHAGTGHGGICVREGDDNQLDRAASVLQAFSNVSDHARVAALTATHD